MIRSRETGKILSRINPLVKKNSQSHRALAKKSFGGIMAKQKPSIMSDSHGDSRMLRRRWWSFAQTTTWEGIQVVEQYGFLFRLSRTISDSTGSYQDYLALLDTYLTLTLISRNQISGSSRERCRYLYGHLHVPNA